MAIQDTPDYGVDKPDEQIDPKELKEREEAAQAYAEEHPEHLVDYCQDCVNLSVQAMLDIRMMQEECWRVFNEEEPDNWGLKELWQSRITYPKPDKLVRLGQAFTREGFAGMDFLRVENSQDGKAAEFWTIILTHQAGRDFANFPVSFSDATAMALAVGTSLEVIPRWESGVGLNFALAFPENIHRDPAAESRQPWSGRYWIHQEWQPYWMLKQGEEDGIYQNIQDFAVGGSWTTSHDLSQEEIARRKNMVHVQGRYNPTVMVSEFWGMVLSPKGEMLLPRAWYAVAGNQVIRKPTASPYPSLRWPGVGFSALPNLRRYDGRGLMQGIRSLWYFANNLLSLHADNINWVVNPMTELNQDDMVYPTDNQFFPGKYIPTYRTEHGQPVIRTVERNVRNNDILAMLSKTDMIIDNGSPIDQNIQGSPGWRSYVTKGEKEMNLGQSNIFMKSLVTDIEDGALNIVKAMAETIRINLTYDELRRWYPEYAEAYRDPSAPTGLNLPPLTGGTFKLNSLSAFLEHQQNLQNLQAMESLFAPDSVFLPYLKPYPYLKARVKYTNLVDLGILVPEEQATSIDQAQQQQQEAGIKAQQEKQAQEVALAGAQAHEVGAEGDRHLAQAQDYLTSAAAAGAGAAGPEVGMEGVG